MEPYSQQVMALVALCCDDDNDLDIFKVMQIICEYQTDNAITRLSNFTETGEIIDAITNGLSQTQLDVIVENAIDEVSKPTEAPKPTPLQSSVGQNRISGFKTNVERGDPEVQLCLTTAELVALQTLLIKTPITQLGSDLINVTLDIDRGNFIDLNA